MTTPKRTPSKRTALRFAGCSHSISYKTDYENGQARLINISTSGCAIDNANVELSLDEKILLSISLDNPAESISIQAVVVRENETGYGLKFLHLEDEHKHSVLRFFSPRNRLLNGNTPDTQ